MVNSGSDKAYDQYAAYVVAFMSKRIAKIENVIVYYGPQGAGMTKKGILAGFAIQDSVKKLMADQIERLSPSDLPGNPGKLACFENDELGVNIASCGTFHVIDGFATAVDDKSKIDDFVALAKLLQAAAAILGADKILHF